MTCWYWLSTRWFFFFTSLSQMWVLFNCTAKQWIILSCFRNGCHANIVTTSSVELYWSALHLFEFISSEIQIVCFNFEFLRTNGYFWAITTICPFVYAEKNRLRWKGVLLFVLVVVAVAFPLLGFSGWPFYIASLYTFGTIGSSLIFEGGIRYVLSECLRTPRLAHDL